VAKFSRVPLGDLRVNTQTINKNAKFAQGWSQYATRFLPKFIKLW